MLKGNGPHECAEGKTTGKRGVKVKKMTFRNEAKKTLNGLTRNREKKILQSTRTKRGSGDGTGRRGFELQIGKRDRPNTRSLEGHSARKNGSIGRREISTKKKAKKHSRKSTQVKKGGRRTAPFALEKVGREKHNMGVKIPVVSCEWS